MNEPRKVEIVTMGTVGQGRVLVDGEDISERVAGVRIAIDPLEANRIEIRLAPSKVEFSGQASPIYTHTDCPDCPGHRRFA